MKSEGARTTLIDHASTFINQINSIRPPRVRLLGGVVETIDERRKLNAELAHTHVRNLLALSDVLWAGKDDLVANVALHLPNIAGMSFQNIDGVELYTLTIFIVELVECRNLPPKWRSGVASEDQYHGLVVTK